MRSEEVDWKLGNVEYWDLDFLAREKPLGDQVENLKEDLCQVSYGERVIDVGWYPEFSGEGSFVVMVIRLEQWDAPLFRESCDSVDSLISCLERAVVLAGMAG